MDFAYISQEEKEVVEQLKHLDQHHIVAEIPKHSENSRLRFVRQVVAHLLALSPVDSKPEFNLSWGYKELLFKEQEAIGGIKRWGESLRGLSASCA
jgi:hypothetical protein